MSLQFQTDICTMGKLTDKYSLLEKQFGRDGRFLMLWADLWGQEGWAASPRAASSVSSVPAGRDPRVCTGFWVKLSWWVKTSCSEGTRRERIWLFLSQFSSCSLRFSYYSSPSGFQILSSLSTACCEHSLDPKWILLRKPKVSPAACGFSGGSQDRTCSSGEHHKQDPDHAQRDMMDSPVSEITCPFSLPILRLMSLFLHSIVQYLLNKRRWTGEKELITLVQNSWQGFHLLLKTHIMLSKPSLGPPFPSNHPTLSKSTCTVSKEDNLVHSPKEKSRLKNPACQVDWSC